MRAFLMLGCIAGFCRVLGAFVIAVDQAVTDEDRAAVHNAIADRAAANEKMSRR